MPEVNTLRWLSDRRYNKGEKVSEKKERYFKSLITGNKNMRLDEVKIETYSDVVL